MFEGGDRMEKIAKSLVDLIGYTPLLQLARYASDEGVNEESIIAKLEYFNPAGSVKDRIAIAMINDAEASGVLNQDSEIVEATSGNTGIGLAFVAAAKGYSLTLVMPETMSIERRGLLAALGAKLVLTEGAKGMKGAIAKAQEICESNPKAIMLKQFDNLSNPEVHRQSTAREIWEDTNGKVDIFVAGVGTGGTITGVGEVLKQKNPHLKIVAVEPESSAVLSGHAAGSHKIQGIGAGFIPSILNVNLLDEVIQVSNEEAILTARKLAKSEGLLVGVSSGAAVFAATQLAKRPENVNKRIVVICPDTGERYLSTGLYEV